MQSALAAAAAFVTMITLTADATVAETSRPIRILAMGTSLTANQPWTKALVEKVTACGSNGAEINVIAAAGETSRWGRRQIALARSLKPDVVLVEFAVNDAAIHRFVSLRESLDNMTAIIIGLRAEPPSPRLIIMGMNPTFGLRGWLRTRRPAFETAHRDLAEKLGVEYIDFSKEWLALSAAELVRAIPDGVHPEPSKAAAVMTPSLASVIARRRCEP